MGPLAALFIAGAGLKAYGQYQQGKIEQRASALEAQQLERAALSNIATGAMKIRDYDRQAAQANAGITLAAVDSGLAGNQLDWMRSQLKEDTSLAKLAELFSYQTESEGMLTDASLRRQSGRNAMKMARLRVASTILGSATQYQIGKG